VDADVAAAAAASSSSSNDSDGMNMDTTTVNTTTPRTSFSSSMSVDGAFSSSNSQSLSIDDDVDDNQDDAIVDSNDESQDDQDGTNHNYADMPSLSSFRSVDDRSSVGSSTFAHGASGGTDSFIDSHSDSLPSLSSFRIDDLSAASSYHSRGSAASVASAATSASAATLTNFSNHSAATAEEGWSSFNNDDDDNGGDGDDILGATSAPSAGKNDAVLAAPATNPSTPSASTTDVPSPLEMMYPASATTITGNKVLATATTKSILRNKGDRGMSGPPKPPTRRWSRDESTKLNEFGVVINQFAGRPATLSGNAYEASHGSDDDDDEEEDFEKPDVDSNDSMAFSELSERPALVSSSEQGSSSSGLRLDGSMSSTSRGGGDSLPRLPRRTSSAYNENDDDESDDDSVEIQIGESIGKQSETSSDDDEDLALAMNPRDKDDEDSDCSVPSDTEHDDDHCTDNDVTSDVKDLSRSSPQSDGETHASLSTLNDVEEKTDEIQDKPRRRGVVRRISSSLKRMGKTASFGMIGANRKGKRDTIKRNNRAGNSL
jgi:hypothetical protein